MTSLAGKIYLLRATERDQVEVYDDVTYGLQRRLNVPNAGWLNDMASCKHYGCIYVVDDSNIGVVRLDVQRVSSRWGVYTITPLAYQ